MKFPVTPGQFQVVQSSDIRKDWQLAYLKKKILPIYIAINSFIVASAHALIKHFPNQSASIYYYYYYCKKKSYLTGATGAVCVLMVPVGP